MNNKLILISLLLFFAIGVKGQEITQDSLTIDEKTTLLPEVVVSGHPTKKQSSFTFNKTELQLAGAFLAPFMLGLYWRGVTPASVWACFIWGVGLTVINMLLGNPINPINCGAIAMVGGFPVVWLVSLFSPKMNRKTVDKIFECYK